MCPQNKGLDKLCIVTYVCNGLEHVCISVIDICCAGWAVLDLGCLILIYKSSDDIFLVIYYLAFQLNLKDANV